MIGPEPPLAQKRYGEDPWRVVVVSMLLCQTKSKTARPVIDEFFRRFPRAEAAARASEDEIREVIAPLGLHNVRSARLGAMSYVWMLDEKVDGRPSRPCVEWVRAMPGVGKYVSDAYRLVVLGQEVEPDDWALARWARWRWTHPVP